jgi:pseudouridine-5'-phosphate glycosidase
MPANIQISQEVRQALELRLPVVALESTVITHGLPYPENLKLARDMEAEVSRGEAVPATVGVIEGVVRVGLQEEHLEMLSQGGALHKISVRDFAPAIAFKWSGGTTVAGTMLAAYAAGIRVFATGGIGGVHREVVGETSRQSADISADLPQLSKTPMIVVCAGAKAILDLPATLEYLETASVPVVGFGTSEFPAFYSRESGLPTSIRAEDAREVVEIAEAQWSLGLKSALLVVVPPPEEDALPRPEVDRAIRQALQEAYQEGVRGQEVTPYLLARVAGLTGGGSLKANLSLLRNNARIATQIAREIARRQQKTV